MQVFGENMWAHEKIEDVVSDREMWREGIRVADLIYMR